MFALSRPAEEKVSDLIYFKIYFPLNICATVKKTPSNFPTFWEVEKELSNNFLKVVLRMSSCSSSHWYS